MQSITPEINRNCKMNVIRFKAWFGVTICLDHISLVIEILWDQYWTVCLYFHHIEKIR